MPTVKEIKEHLNTYEDDAVIATTIWCVEDVLGLEPKLTNEQAESVLEAAHENFDAGLGINWGTFEYEISRLIGKE